MGENEKKVKKPLQDMFLRPLEKGDFHEISSKIKELADFLTNWSKLVNLMGRFFRKRNSFL